MVTWRWRFEAADAEAGAAAGFVVALRLVVVFERVWWLALRRSGTVLVGRDCASYEKMYLDDICKNTYKIDIPPHC